MVKEPRVGRVKTRLGRDIGAVPATWWFRHQLRGVLRRVTDPRWDVILAVAPDNAVLSRAFPAHLGRMAQGHGDLGRRMAQMLRKAPRGPVLLIGADIPGVNAAQVAQAFAILRHHDFVFGPAPDGGFWATGAARRRALPFGLFEGCRWSTEHAMTDSIATLDTQRFGLANCLADVDTGADLALSQNSPRRDATPVIGPRT